MKLSLKAKLYLGFFFVSLIPAAIMTFVAVNMGSESLTESGYNQLSAVNSIKKAQIEQFFEERKSDITVLSQTPYVIEAARELHKAAQKAAGTGKPSLVEAAEYKQVHDRYYSYFKNYLDSYGYYDIFLASPETGWVYFTVVKESDFATHLKDEDHHLADSWRAVKESLSIHLTDTEPYAPSFGAPAQFIATPMLHKGELIGVLAFQIPLDPINRIMGLRAGMGTSGESYLVGADLLMRSDSYLNPDEYSVEASFRKNHKSGTISVKAALGGARGVHIISDYRGIDVLSAYDTLNITPEITWAVISEIDEGEALEAIRTLLWNAVAVLVGIVIVSLGVATFMGVSISGPLSHVVESLTKVSLSVREGSKHLTAGSQELASNSVEQASAVQETSASLEELNAMVTKNVEDLKETHRLSLDMNEMVTRGHSAMSDLYASMLGIQESNQRIENLVKIISNIGEKTKVMDEIVFQTKLLSFNASVEAERAGEHGRGFAVVAQEVGNLAKMSGESAREIASIVKESVCESSQIIEENHEKVERGQKQVEQTSEVFAVIHSSTGEVLESTQRVLRASEEQSMGLSQVHSALTQIDSVTQNIAATSEETASTAETMNHQVVELDGVVGQLMAVVKGKTAAAEDHSIESKGALASEGDSSAPTNFSSKKLGAERTSFHGIPDEWKAA